MTADPKSIQIEAESRRVRQRGKTVAMRSIRFRVPDTRSPVFRAEAARQSALVAASPGESDDQAFIDAVTIQHGG